MNIQKIYRNILNRVSVLTVFLIVLLVFFSVFEIILQIANFNDRMQAKQEAGSGNRFASKKKVVNTQYLNMARENKLLFFMGTPLAPVDPTVFGAYDKDPLLFWKLRPSSTNNVNARRYRGKIVPYVKPQDTLRILVIGDSCAYGAFVDDERDTYAHILEDKLNAKSSKRFEVINAGVPGYSSLQGLRYLKTELLKYQPDCIIVGFGFNDLCEAVGVKDKDIPVSLFPTWLFTVDSTLGNLRSYRFMKQLAFGIRYRYLKFFNRSKVCAAQNTYPSLDKITDVDTFIITLSAQYAKFPLRRVPPQDFSDNIIEIIKLARTHHSQVFLLTLPSVDGCFVYEQLLRLIARKYGVPLVDLIEEFKDIKANTQDFFVDNNHYNLKGHRLVADLLFERLKKYKK